MRYAFAAAVLACSSPAVATGGFECRPVSGTGPVLTIGVGHAVAARPFNVTLREGSHTLSTQGPRAALEIGQSWIDARYLWLDLTDAGANRFEAKLRTTFQPKLKYRPALGTLVRGGRTYRVRCIEA
ncbi:MAG TPA: hypothetical protein VFZ91_01615 [Allosphingosinicella sp.]